MAVTKPLARLRNAPPSRVREPETPRPGPPHLVRGARVPSWHLRVIRSVVEVRGSAGDASRDHQRRRPVDGRGGLGPGARARSSTSDRTAAPLDGGTGVHHHRRARPRRSGGRRPRRSRRAGTTRRGPRRPRPGRRTRRPPTERRNTSTTSTGKGTSASVAYPGSPRTGSASGWMGTIRLPCALEQLGDASTPSAAGRGARSTAHVSHSSSIRSTHSCRCQSLTRASLG